MRECLSRGALLRVGLAGGGSTLFSAAPRYAAGQLDAGEAEPVALKTDFGFKGSARNTPIRFRAATFGNLWNQLQPERHPRIIAQSTDDPDVSAAVKFPREHVENRSP